tara:strand:- start:1270 stop:1752 length:483 start_codon:yes stop_codon:yes gene_type:complete
MGLKIAFICIIIMGILGGIGYWYYTDSQAKMAVMQQEIGIQKVAIEQQTEAIEKQLEDVKKAQVETQKLNEKFEEARKQVDSLSDKFNKTSKLLGKRDIGVLAINKPRAIKRIITRGTEQHLRCFEIVSGSPLTEKETNAEKKSQQNSHCPDIANPNRMQ